MNDITVFGWNSFLLARKVPVLYSVITLSE